MKSPADATPHRRLRTFSLTIDENLAILAGIMLTTALPPFRGTGWLAPCALALFLRALLRADRPLRAAWLMGLAHQTSLLYWLFLLKPSAAIPTLWLVPIQAAAAILYVSLFYLVFGWAVQRIQRWLGAAAALALAPVLWTGMEAWRAMGELGFPWCLSGSAWLETPLLPLAAASGEIGLSAATAFTAAAALAATELRGVVPARRVRRLWREVMVGTALLLWAALFIGSSWRAPSASVLANGQPRHFATVRIAAVQANVALKDKWDSARIDSTKVPYTRLTALAADAGAELVVWAETAVPAYLLYGPALLDWVRQMARRHGVYLYIGFPDVSMTADGQRLRHNSSGLFDPEGFLQDRYAKHHLLPIGERMPFSRLLPFLARIDVGQAEWSPGEPPLPLRMRGSKGEFHFASLICFESIFADLARQAVRRGAQALVNITNDGWFGKTAGPRQHAALARLRAVECGVPVIRCANNGISFITDKRGKILGSADLGQRAVVIADVVPEEGGTIFVRRGAWPLAIFLAAWTLLALVLTRRRTSEPEPAP